MNTNTDFLSNSLIIGAHADDELLWFNAILKDVDEVVIVFKDFWAHPEIGQNREKAIKDFPRDNVTLLDIDESGAIGCADWANPKLTSHGIDLSKAIYRREFKRRAKLAIRALTPMKPCVASKNVAELYNENYAKIRDALLPRLSPEMNVFSHNPWGEYGHEDHIQVFRVLDDLRKEIGFKLWVTNYCSERSLALAAHYFTDEPTSYIRLKTNKDFAAEVVNVYRKHNCWTWGDNWRWFDEECYFQAPETNNYARPKSLQHLMPLNFFTIEQ